MIVLGRRFILASSAASSRSRRVMIASWATFILAWYASRPLAGAKLPVKVVGAV